MGGSEGSFDTHMAVLRTVLVSLLVLVVILILLNMYLFNDQGPWFEKAIANVPIFKLWD